MSNQLSYRNFSASRAMAPEPGINPLAQVAEQVPLSTSLCFLLSGVLVMAAATAGAVYGLGPMGSACILSFLGLAVLAFIYGSSCWPDSIAADETDEDTILSEASRSLNHAFWMMLSGACMLSTFVVTALMWRRSLDLLAVQILCGVGCVVSFCIGSSLANRDAAPAASSEPDDEEETWEPEPFEMHEFDWNPPEESGVVSLLEPEEETWQAPVIDEPLRQQLEALIARSPGPSEPVIPSYARVPHKEPLEYAVTDERSIEKVLWKMLGTAGRLLR